MDFTLNRYTELIKALKAAGYKFLTFEEYCNLNAHGDAKPERLVILRHDIDLKAKNSGQIAEIEHSQGVKASYYFRVVPESNKPAVIKAIAEMGHEIGYHYEDMSICHGNTEKAYLHFQQWIKYFRNFYPVKTICMHGAPTSKYDGKDLWKKYNYRDCGVIGEPYFDIDFSKMFYLTDTGRMWDGYKVSVRDKIPQYQDEWVKAGLVYHTTQDVINAIKASKLPPRLMITTHPQRWTNDPIHWLLELVVQSIKNVIKKRLIGKSMS